MKPLSSHPTRLVVSVILYGAPKITKKKHHELSINPQPSSSMMAVMLMEASASLSIEASTFLFFMHDAKIHGTVTK